MADQGLFDKSTQTSRNTGDFVRINRAYAPNPSGRADYKITVDNLLSAEQADIATNTANIATNTSDISDLQDINTIQRLAEQTGIVPISQNANSFIKEIYFNISSGSPTVSVGTNPATAPEDIVSDGTVASQGRAADISYTKGYSSGARTIYVTITNGNVDITYISTENLYL